LHSIYEHTKSDDYEIIVVDNCSSDDTVELVREKFPEVRIIQNDENLGFGAANNKGAQMAEGEYLFFLNPDTELRNDVLKIFSSQSLGICHQVLGGGFS